MPYATTTLAQATSEVAERLGDPTFIRWSQAELSDLVRESIRTWNALTGHFRDVGVFNTTSGLPFYDLPTVLPGLRGYTVTDRTLVGVIEAHLLEPVTPTVWTGTDQFTLADVTTALQRRRDQFLIETGMVLTRSTFVVVPSASGRFPLDESVITPRRVGFRTDDGVTTPVHREDVWAFNHFAKGWPQRPGRPPESPFGYSIGETPPLVMQFVPPLSDRGTVDLMSVNRGAVLNPVTPVLMGVPDDWTWVVKFGALWDLLAKDGLANDPPRAQYCQQRWQQGIDTAKAASTVWAARINDVPIDLAALTDADQFRANWQNESGSPDTALLSAGNVVALVPVPNTPVSGSYSVTLDIVRNAPVPTLLTDFLQVGPELLDTIYGYTEHLAKFKSGIYEIEASAELLNEFYRVAGVTFRMDTAQTPNLPLLTGQTMQDEKQTPRVASA